jgi:hypothetical protein
VRSKIADNMISPEEVRDAGKRLDALRRYL